jgi:predicted esterase
MERLVIGGSDDVFLPDGQAAERARLDAAGVRYDVVEYDAGHSIKRAVCATLAEKIAADP